MTLSIAVLLHTLPSIAGVIAEAPSPMTIANALEKMGVKRSLLAPAPVAYAKMDKNGMMSSTLLITPSMPLGEPLLSIDDVTLYVSSTGSYLVGTFFAGDDLEKLSPKLSAITLTRKTAIFKLNTPEVRLIADSILAKTSPSEEIVGGNILVQKYEVKSVACKGSECQVFPLKK